jgi:hypothetical protein
METNKEDIKNIKDVIKMLAHATASGLIIDMCDDAHKSLDNILKSTEILKVLAKMCEDGKSITIAPDWGYGSGTLINPDDGSHTHFGLDISDNEEEGLTYFIDGLHNQLVLGNGLSWTKIGELK